MCCANFPITPRRSPATAPTNISAPSRCACRIRKCDFLIVEGYDGPQPPASGAPPAAAANKGYWIGHIDVTDAEGYKPYMVADQAPFGEFGGRYLVRGGKQETPEGKSRSRTVVLEFPSYDAALACYRSPGYQAAKKLRDGKAEFDLVIVEGYDGPKF